MKRHHITLGASTTADGIVVSATAMISINGARVALEGDAIDCRACGSTGIIRCAGPRIAERYNGKQVALEHDLCICKCPKPPRLIANQTSKAQFIGDSDTHWVAPHNLAEGKHGAAYDQRFLLLDRQRHESNTQIKRRQQLLNSSSWSGNERLRLMKERAQPTQFGTRS